MKTFRWITQTHLKTTLISAVSFSIWDGVAHFRYVTGEEHDAFFTIGAGEDKNQIRQIYHHIMSMCFSYLLVICLYSLPSWTLSVIGLMALCPARFDKIWQRLNYDEYYYFIEYFSKQNSQQIEKKCYFNNQMPF
jgi:hypothetical protein